MSAAKEFGMRAVGLTDHGTVAGAIKFMKSCREEGIKPIIGMESYLARNHLCHDKCGQPDGRKGNRHINVIAKNSKGLANLFALSQGASLDGYYYDPRVDLELLDKHKEGLIITSACLSNVVNFLLLRDKYEAAKKAVAQFKDIFGDDYYMEIMFHGLTSEAKVLPDIQKLAKQMDVKTIVTNDCHYIKREDAEFQEYLMCMSSGRCIRDPKRIKFPFEEFYFKSEEEMLDVFGHCRQSMMNTLEIADKCDYSDIILGGNMRLPKFILPLEWSDPLKYMEDLAWKGLKKCNLHESSKHRERLKREIDDVKLIWSTKRYNFSTYFLMVEDMMGFAKKKGIAAGIRGSGYGSLLLKCLGITEGVDPLEFDLLWERFLGFDDKHFFSEDDYGIGKANVTSDVEDSEDIDVGDPTDVMFERYI